MRVSIFQTKSVKGTEGEALTVKSVRESSLPRFTTKRMLRKSLLSRTDHRTYTHGNGNFRHARATRRWISRRRVLFHGREARLFRVERACVVVVVVVVASLLAHAEVPLRWPRTNNSTAQPRANERYISLCDATYVLTHVVASREKSRLKYIPDRLIATDIARRDASRNRRSNRVLLSLSLYFSFPRHAANQKWWLPLVSAS